MWQKVTINLMNDEIFKLINDEENRQEETLMMIPSENYASKAVREAVGSVLGNKYAEGYPGKRYYQGNTVVDEIEKLAQERGKRLFGFEHINVQPYSGSPANTAVMFALLNPGDTICGLKLSAGGHLTHGHPDITFSGKYFRSVQYEVNEEGKIDYEALAKIVLAEKPKLLIAGTTAYPFILDWNKFREIADSVNAWLLADISHIAGLVVGGVHPSPVEFADIVTSTTHKTLRGPRGAFIGITKVGLTKDEDLVRKIDRAVFPGLQGGPHENTIAGMAVAFAEAGTDEFKRYAEQVVGNAKVLADELRKNGLKVFGTENHLMLIDVGKEMGREMAVKLEDVNIVVNANTIPYDQGTAFKPSGVRLGTPGLTSRGMGETEMKEIASYIAMVVKGEETSFIKTKVKDLCKRFPVNK